MNLRSKISYFIINLTLNISFCFKWDRITDSRTDRRTIRLLYAPAYCSGWGHKMYMNENSLHNYNDMTIMLIFSTRVTYHTVIYMSRSISYRYRYMYQVLVCRQ